jgi:endonuclease YncB( thermonuclease family)
MPDPVTPPTPGERFWYEGEVLKVTDGDTVRVRLDLGCDTFRRETLRVYGINAPESKGVTAAAGKAATAFLQELLPAGTRLLAHTIKDKKEKWGRLLADMYTYGPEGNVLPDSISKRMTDAGHAQPYFGGPR